jgi:hypothetical protein
MVAILFVASHQALTSATVYSCPPWLPQKQNTTWVHKYHADVSRPMRYVQIVAIFVLAIFLH